MCFKKNINIIAAVDKNYGIGHKMYNGLLWKIPEEMKHFKQLTSFSPNPKTCNAVIMGRKTWESIKCKPLKGRINIIISRKMKEDTNKLSEFNVFNSLNKSVQWCYENDKINEIFVIGGVSIYNETIKYACSGYLYISEIDNNYGCDLLFPKFNLELVSTIKSEGLDKNLDKKMDISYNKYKLKETGEIQYLKLLKEILEKGNRRKTRNGITRSLFGKTLKFDLSEGFPLLTTKKMYFKGIFEKLIWFLKGSTNAIELAKKKNKNMVT